jgi:plastocyanin
MRSHLISHYRGIIPTVLIAVLALIVAACGGGASATGATATDTPIPPAPSATAAATVAATNTTGATTGATTISMGTGHFTGTLSVTIKAGQSVTFDDTGGGPHNLVTGTHGTYSHEAGAPAAFTPSGITFSGGDKQTVMFPTAGTYQITCTFHPAMQATVTVTA